MRSNELPAIPSRKVFTIGMAPPTAASKLSATWCFSASAASLTPCLASSALLAVTTDLPDARAASTALLAGSPAPPINSTKTSMPAARASAIGSEYHFVFLRSMPRSLPRARAQTAAISIARPQRAASASRWRTTWAIKAAPTVPNPATPTFSGVTMKLAPGGERDDVVKVFRRGFKEAADIARGLTDALFVLHQRDAHEALAIFAETNAGRDREFGLLHQQGRKFNAAETVERLRDRRPGEHRGARARHLKAGASEAFHQHVAAALVRLAHLLDAIVGTGERRDGRHLHRREGAVIEIGFHPRQRRDHALVADREADAPARHRKRLRHRSEFDRDIHRARHLQQRGRRIAVEIDFRVSQIGQHQDAVRLGEGDQVLVEVEARHIGGRIGRIAHHHHGRFRDRVNDRALQRMDSLFYTSDAAAE